MTGSAAARIAAVSKDETATPARVSRFRSEAAFARHAGVAPIPHWSGPNTVRLRPARAGNRQLNVALYRIAMTQIRHNGPADAYYRKRRDFGDSHAQALRRVERRVARSVFGRLRADQINRAAASENMRSLSEPDR
jgi:transposase